MAGFGACGPNAFPYAKRIQQEPQRSRRRELRFRQSSLILRIHKDRQEKHAALLPVLVVP